MNVRGNRMASRAEVFEKAHNDGLFMKVQLDGMDQAKFSLPRLKRLVGTSMLSKIWRPNIHVVGCVVFGMVECYYLMSQKCQYELHSAEQGLGCRGGPLEEDGKRLWISTFFGDQCG